MPLFYVKLLGVMLGITFSASHEAGDHTAGTKDVCREDELRRRREKGTAQHLEATSYNINLKRKATLTIEEALIDWELGGWSRRHGRVDGDIGPAGGGLPRPAR